jgi:two-component system, OmpR family, phosphate regulon sensor histidine kinase PhoR
MSAADDDALGRRLTGWFGWRSRESELPSGGAPPGDQETQANGLAGVAAMVACLPDPVILLDRDGRVMDFNAGAAAVAPALRRGDPASIVLRMPELVEAMREVYATATARRIEFSERVPTERHFEAFLSPVMLSRQQAMLITLHDLTAIRRVEEMRADFVANASHELRTPLAALTGFIETMQGPAREDPKARDRFLGIMREQAWRMARLIDDLLSLSRIELRAHMRPDTPVDVVPIVKQVVDGLQTLAQDRGVVIAIALDTGADTLPVLGDRDELLRLFENLIENGLKYGASGKRVDVRLGQSTGAAGRPEASIVVRDYGPGIAAEHLPRLTERFYRVDVGESRTQGGTGLGLALVKHILNRHHGRLSIESQPGKGAIFTVRLPLAAAAA